MITRIRTRPRTRPRTRRGHYRIKSKPKPRPKQKLVRRHPVSLGGGRNTPNLKWRTWAERVQIFDDVVNALHAVVNGDELCARSGMFGEAIKLGSRIGSRSIYGEVNQAYLIGKQYRLAVKKVAIREVDRKRAYAEHHMKSQQSAWGELAAYMLGSILVMAKVCNNLPFTYKYTLCKRCKFVNKAIGGRSEKPCILVVNEFAEGDLGRYLKDTQRWSLKLVENCIFQVAIGLYAMEKYFRGMTHNDLHYGNVLVHEVKPGGYWVYKIDGKRYYLPNLGYVFVLWDFSDVHIPGRIKGWPKKQKKGQVETDIGQISGLISERLERLIDNSDSVIHHILRLEGRISLKDIIAYMFSSYRSKPAKGVAIDQFNMDTSIDSIREAVPPPLRPFLTHRRTFDSHSR